MDKFQDGKYLIINADDFGMCHATNTAISTLFNNGRINSASLMMTGPWLNEAVNYIKQSNCDIGIHITVTSEWENYKWKPLTDNSRTLLDSSGNFTHDVEHIWNRADTTQLRKEAEAQLQLAYHLGLAPSNIDHHMGALLKEIDILLDLCEQYRLPLRYARNSEEYWHQLVDHQYVLQEVERRGIIIPDYVIGLPFFAPEGQEANYEVTKSAALTLLSQLEVGVTELVMHPSIANEELQAITSTYPLRQAEYDVWSDPEVKQLLIDKNIQLIGWKDLMELQRSLGQ